MPKQPQQRAFRGKTIEEATDMLADEFAVGSPHTKEAAREHLLDYRQHCIRWALEGLARQFEQDRPGAWILSSELVKSIRLSTAKYERGEL